MMHDVSSHIVYCYNYFLDFLKGLGCIGVVLIHITFPALFGGCVLSVDNAINHDCENAKNIEARRVTHKPH